MNEEAKLRENGGKLEGKWTRKTRLLGNNIDPFDVTSHEFKMIEGCYMFSFS